MKNLRPGPFRKVLVGAAPSSSPLSFPSFGAICIVPFLVGGEITPSWTRGSTLPPVVPVNLSVGGYDEINPAGWTHATVQTPPAADQYFGRTINDPDPLIATAPWLRGSTLPPLVPGNITLGAFDRVDANSWTRSSVQPQAAQAGQFFGQAINQPDPGVLTREWLRGTTQTPITPSVAQVFGKAVSEPYLTIGTASWVRPSILPALVPANITIGGFDAISTPSWLHTGGQGPVTVTGTTSFSDARHRDFLATPSWLRPTPTATPATPATNPPAGTVFIGAAWPHQQPFVWLSRTPTAEEEEEEDHGGGGRVATGRAARRWVFSKRYADQLLGEPTEEAQFLESVSTQLVQAAKPTQAPIAREIGQLSALNALAGAYQVHFESVAAAHAAIQERQIELEEDDLMAVLMIIAMADDP